LDDRRAFLSRPKRPRSAAIIVLALTYSTAVCAGDSEHQLRDALAALAGDFAKARALPLGSRPEPPDWNLQPLLGLRAFRLRSTLGSPDRPVDGYHFECGARLCWAFTYGPAGHEESTVIRQDNGLNTVVVTTGGPYQGAIRFLAPAIDQGRCSPAVLNELICTSRKTILSSTRLRFRRSLA
jgi:hypothetical protein